MLSKLANMKRRQIKNIENVCENKRTATHNDSVQIKFVISKSNADHKLKKYNGYKYFKKRKINQNITLKIFSKSHEKEGTTKEEGKELSS